MPNAKETSPENDSMIIKVVSSVLDRLIINAKNDISLGGYFLKFQSSYAPEVSIQAYLDRIRKYSRCSDSCFIMALIYIDRLIETRSLVLSPLNVHRLLITVVMLAAKYHDDLFYNNAYYAKLGGLTLQELNHLEVEMLTLFNYSMFIHVDAFHKYALELRNYIFSIDIIPSPVSVSMSPTAPSMSAATASPNRATPQRYAGSNHHDFVCTTDGADTAGLYDFGGPGACASKYSSNDSVHAIDHRAARVQNSIVSLLQQQTQQSQHQHHQQQQHQQFQQRQQQFHRQDSDSTHSGMTTANNSYASLHGAAPPVVPGIPKVDSYSCLFGSYQSNTASHSGNNLLALGQTQQQPTQQQAQQQFQQQNGVANGGGYGLYHPQQPGGLGPSSSSSSSLDYSYGPLLSMTPQEYYFGGYHQQHLRLTNGIHGVHGGVLNDSFSGPSFSLYSEVMPSPPSQHQQQQTQQDHFTVGSYAYSSASVMPSTVSMGGGYSNQSTPNHYNQQQQQQQQHNVVSAVNDDNDSDVDERNNINNNYSLYGQVMGGPGSDAVMGDGYGRGGEYATRLSLSGTLHSCHNGGQSLSRGNSVSSAHAATPMSVPVPVQSVDSYGKPLYSLYRTNSGSSDGGGGCGGGYGLNLGYSNNSSGSGVDWQELQNAQYQQMNNMLACGGGGGGGGGQSCYAPLGLGLDMSSLRSNSSGHTSASASQYGGIVSQCPTPRMDTPQKTHQQQQSYSAQYHRAGVAPMLRAHSDPLSGGALYGLSTVSTPTTPAGCYRSTSLNSCDNVIYRPSIIQSGGGGGGRQTFQHARQLQQQQCGTPVSHMMFTPQKYHQQQQLQSCGLGLSLSHCNSVDEQQQQQQDSGGCGDFMTTAGTMTPFSPMAYSGNGGGGSGSGLQPMQQCFTPRDARADVYHHQQGQLQHQQPSPLQQMVDIPAMVDIHGVYHAPQLMVSGGGGGYAMAAYPQETLLSQQQQSPYDYHRHHQQQHHHQYQQDLRQSRGVAGVVY